jgi:hypothetical protein
MIIQFPGAERATRRGQHRRRRAQCPRSLHIYRRALIRRIGLSGGGRPAQLLDTVARTLIAARVA